MCVGWRDKKWPFLAIAYLVRMSGGRHVHVTVPVEEIYDRVVLPAFEPFQKYRK
jgi:hypothetical protein